MSQKEQGGTEKTNQKTIFTRCPVLLVCLFYLFNAGIEYTRAINKRETFIDC